MKKLYLIVWAMAVGIFILPAVSFSQTFDPPSPVHVSGNAGGKIFLESSDPATLDMISGAVQFHNDIMKSRGWGMTNNAFRSAERVSQNLLTIQLYEGTLKTQFSFNIKSGALWGLIPSCNLIPDGYTVVTEYSGPSRDSEDSNGGHHFSLIASITDPSYYKAVGNIMPCPSGIVQPVEVPVQISPAPAPIVQQVAPAPAPAVAPVVAVAKKTPAVKKPKVEKCDPCAEIKKVQEAVGEATDEEKSLGLGDLHKKATKQLEVAKETKQVFGEPKTEGETVFSKLEKIESLVTPIPLPKYETPPPLPEKNYALFWWIALLVALIAAAVIGSYFWQQRGKP